MACENSFLSNEQNKTFIAFALLKAAVFYASFNVFIEVSGASYLVWAADQISNPLASIKILIHVDQYA